MTLIRSSALANLAEPMQQNVFWKLEANGSAAPYVLPGAILKGGGETESQLKRPDIDVLAYRYRPPASRPSFSLVPHPGSDVPNFGARERRELLLWTSSPLAADYGNVAAAIQEVHGLYSNGQDLYLLAPRQKNFVARFRCQLQGGRMRIRTKGAERGGNPIEDDPSYFFRFEIFVARDLDVPLGYLFKIQQRGGTALADSDIKFSQSSLGYDSVITTDQHRNAARTIGNINGTMNSQGFTFRLELIMKYLAAQGVIPGRTPRVYSILMTAREQGGGMKEGLRTIKERIREKKK